jgi:CheY-like chemotaxis protein
MLRTTGSSVLTTTHPEHALHILESARRVDLILSEVLLPDAEDGPSGLRLKVA